MIPTSSTEHALIGGLLYNSERMPDAIAAGFAPAIFADPDCATIAETMVAMWRADRPVDLLTTSKVLPDKADLLHACVDACESPSNALAYLVEVKLDAQRRNVSNVLASAVNDAVSEDPSQVIASVIAKVSDLHKGRTEDLSSVAERMLYEWEHPDTSIPRIQWPVPGINSQLGPITREYVYIAAQPSLGKTAFALQIGIHNTRREIPVSMLSLESTPTGITGRLMACIGQVDVWGMRHGHSSSQERAAYTAAAAELAGLPLRIEFGPMNSDEVVAWGRREAAKGARLLIVDNLKNIMPVKNFKNRFDMFAEHCAALRQLRDMTGLPLVVLHHLNPENKMAWTSDAERDADIVMMITNDNGYIIDTTKNRDGRIGQVPVIFDKPFQTFRDANATAQESEICKHIAEGME